MNKRIARPIPQLDDAAMPPVTPGEFASTYPSLIARYRRNYARGDAMALFKAAQRYCCLIDYCGGVAADMPMDLATEALRVMATWYVSKPRPQLGKLFGVEALQSSKAKERHREAIRVDAAVQEFLALPKRKRTSAARVIIAKRHGIVQRRDACYDAAADKMARRKMGV